MPVLTRPRSVRSGPTTHLPECSRRVDSPHTLQVERIGHFWHVMLRLTERQFSTPSGYARMSGSKQNPPPEPHANRLWAHAGQKGITLDRVVSEIASGLNDRHPKPHRLLVDPRVGTVLV